MASLSFSKLLLGEMVSLFARAAITKYYKRNGLNSRNTLSNSSESWKYEMKVTAELIPSEGYEEDICSRSLSLACR